MGSSIANQSSSKKNDRYEMELLLILIEQGLRIPINGQTRVGGGSAPAIQSRGMNSMVRIAGYQVLMTEC